MSKSLVLLLAFSAISFAGDSTPRITDVSPASGPEGTRIEILGASLETTREVRFGATSALFRINSGNSITALVPMHAPSGPIMLVGPLGRIESASVFRVENDPRIPDEVRYKTGYVNILSRPPAFHVALLWGIAIADVRVAGSDKAEIEIAWTELSCRIDGRDVLLNHDVGRIRGGLYLRNPWFHNNTHEAMSFDPPAEKKSVERLAVLRVGQRPHRIWHFWSASGRAPIPAGHLEGCTTRARVRISQGALLQLGMDYWRDLDSLWARHSQNNHEAGVSRWYFPSQDWQDVIFSDITKNKSH